MRVRGQVLFKFGFTLFIDEQPPDAAEKPVNAFYAFGIPGLDHFERAEKHFEEPQRIRPVLLYHVVGIDDVAAGFGHFLAVLAKDQPLVDEFEKRLRGGDKTEVEEHFVPETRIEQMKHRLFTATHVKINAGGWVGSGFGV